MVTGEWLDSWTGVIFFAFFSWPKASAKRARSPRLSPQCVTLAPRFPASFAQKGEQIAPVLRASEWYPFLTCSKESLCIKVDPECRVLNVYKKLVLLLSIISVEKGLQRNDDRKYVCVRGPVRVCMRNCQKRRKMLVFKNIRIRVDEAWHQYPN